MVGFFFFIALTYIIKIYMQKIRKIIKFNINEIFKTHIIVHNLINDLPKGDNFIFSVFSYFCESSLNTQITVQVNNKISKDFERIKF